ncbi:YopX family protein [Lactiplantibacillus plantarum]|uniref:YopX family protein n=1 Tax=Lactiplantibacillus plantarum TaxID=1590 RepID=UPI001F25908B|nr:YopX family protein [Lactiplantibacillus plantarum]
MIKFRAWDDLLNKMLVVYRISFDGPVDGVQVHCYLDDRGAEGSTEYAYDGDGLILEQFTGLKDVNGKDIYEGDIVHGYDQEPDRDDGYIGSSVTDVVNFKYGAFWIGDSWYKVMVMTPPIIEVIGNVHENAELLEAEK